MNRSVVRSIAAALAAVACLWPMAAAAEEVLGYDDMSQTPITGRGPAVATPRPDVVLGLNDVVFGDADEGIIAFGPRFQVAPAVARTRATDLIFEADNEGGIQVDLSAYAGLSNIVLNPSPEAPDLGANLATRWDMDQ